ncbi:MAG TPA: VWA domain-containing protein, partial [Candidatus Sulfomarinibacteraceae bacterium]|nr:VWA domain-containing protein [Candidatus Sulfomarinibacteraceae bacterium]
MSLIAPLALLLGLLAGPIILLYMLRLRRRRVLVSSTMLWQKLMRDREANAPWQRLRRNLLLILQLLILAALVLALARPFLPTPSVVSGSVVVVLDGSPSMRATDVEPSRFESAKAEVGGWIDNLGGDDRMTLILAGRTPTVLASSSNDRALLRQALEAAQPERAPANWPAAIALAGGAAQGFSEARVVIVSDGGLPQDLPPLPAETVYVPIGESAENLALAALATRATEGGPQLFARVSNSGAQDQEALLSIDVNGALFDSRRVQVAAGQTRSLTWDLPADVQTVAARLGDQTEDYLALDDRAWAVHQGGASNRVLIVSEGNRFLEQALNVLPGLTVFRAPADQPLPEDPFDLYVFDSAPLPDPLPDGALLVINPLAQGEEAGAAHIPFSVTGVFSNTTVTRLADSPLLQFVEWRGVNLQRAKSVSAPWAQTIIEAEGGPLLLAGEQSGRRVALLTFALRDSDLPLRIAFPVLMANITDWLSPGRAFDAPQSLQPGQPLAISPGTGASAVLVEKPDGQLWTGPVTGEGALLFDETTELGLYHVRLRDAGGDRDAGSFAVNLFAPGESAIAPAATLQLGQETVGAPGDGDVGRRELWAWLAAAAFLLLLLEW